MIALSIVPPVAAVAILYGRYIRKISKKTQDALANSTQVNLSILGERNPFQVLESKLFEYRPVYVCLYL